MLAYPTSSQVSPLNGSTTLRPSSAHGPMYLCAKPPFCKDLEISWTLCTPSTVSKNFLMPSI